MPHLPTDNGQNGFCWGAYITTVAGEPRLRLNKPIIHILKHHKVRSLWLFSDPTGPRVIICPESKRKTYIELAKRNLPREIDYEVAFRKFICNRQQVFIDQQDRIAFSYTWTDYLNVKPGKCVIFLGVGWWYEVWKEDDYTNMLKKDGSD